VLNSSSYNSAVWSAGEQLVRAGYPAQVVDAGFDWVGSHAGVLARPGRRAAGLPGYETWYDRMFPGLEVCAMVSSSPLSLPGFRLLRVASYDEIGFAVPERLYLYVAERGYCARRAGGARTPEVAGATKVGRGPCQPGGPRGDARAAKGVYPAQWGPLPTCGGGLQLACRPGDQL